MPETATLTPLGHQILEHWKRYRPTMVGNLEGENLRELSVAVRRSEAVALRNPVMPVADGFLG
jgi:hypothetical protein